MKITINLAANDLTLAMGYKPPRIRRYILILCAIKLLDLNWDPRLFDVGYVSGGQEIFFEGIQVTFKLKVDDNTTLPAQEQSNVREYRTDSTT